MLVWRCLKSQYLLYNDVHKNVYEVTIMIAYLISERKKERKVHELIIMIPYLIASVIKWTNL